MDIYFHLFTTYTVLLSRAYFNRGRKKLRIPDPRQGTEGTEASDSLYSIVMITPIFKG